MRIVRAESQLLTKALKVRSASSVTAHVAAMWMSGSLAAVLIWGFAIAKGSGPIWWQQGLEILGQASIVAGGAFTVGALLGFLFGIPKTVQQSPMPASESGARRADSLQSTNTNLEQISDWLTKILVGVGLTQIQSVRGDLAALSSYFAIAGSPSVTLALVLNFAIAGFLTGYLLTRLFLTGAFVEVERSLHDRTIKAEELQEAGDFGAALNEYESALQQVTATTPSLERTKVYTGLIFNSLYEPPPEGFQQAIAYGSRYLKDEERPSPQILAFLAAAYGQQYQYERDRHASPGVLQAIRMKALESARRAVSIDPGTLTLLRMMWDPNDSGKSPGDDDLECFFDDPDFKSLLGVQEVPT
jgi:hypothetical protein